MNSVVKSSMKTSIWINQVVSINNQIGSLWQMADLYE